MSAGVNITLPASGYRNLHLSAAPVIVSSLVSRRRRQLEPPESLAASRIASHSPSHASSPFTPGSRARSSHSVPPEKKFELLLSVKSRMFKSRDSVLLLTAVASFWKADFLFFFFPLCCHVNLRRQREKSKSISVKITPSGGIILLISLCK